MLLKRAIRTSLLTLAAIALLVSWFYVLPKSQFTIGMSLSQIEKKLGHKAHLIPTARAITSEDDRAYSPSYMVSVNRYGVHLYLNSEMRIIRITYLFGSEQHPHYRH